MMKIAAEGVAHLLLRHTHIHLDASVPQEAHAQSTKVGVRIHVAYDLKLKKNKKKGPQKKGEKEKRKRKTLPKTLQKVLKSSLKSFQGAQRLSFLATRSSSQGGVRFPGPRWQGSSVV